MLLFALMEEMMMFMVPLRLPIASICNALAQSRIQTSSRHDRDAQNASSTRMWKPCQRKGLGGNKMNFWLVAGFSFVARPLA